MSNVSNSFMITALLNGQSVNGLGRVHNGPVAQRFTAGTMNFVPNFETMPDSEKSVVYPFLVGTDTARPVNVASADFKYNGVNIVFDAVTKLSTNPNMVGIFKSIIHTITVDAREYNIPAMRIEKNLVILGNYDNDLIEISGKVEIEGVSADYANLQVPVVIEESNASRHSLLITATNEGIITDSVQSLILTAQLKNSGLNVVDTSMYEYKWKIEPNTPLSSKIKTQTVTAAQVSSNATVSCEVLEGSTVIAEGYIQLADATDLLYMRFDKTGIKGSQINSGETATITPKIVKRKSGEIVDSYTSFKFHIEDNEGVNFKPESHPSHEFTAAAAILSYVDVVSAGMGVRGYATTVV